MFLGKRVCFLLCMIGSSTRFALVNLFYAFHLNEAITLTIPYKSCVYLEKVWIVITLRNKHLAQLISRS